MKTEQKQTFTREEVLNAVADVYRREQEEHHRLAERVAVILLRSHASLGSTTSSKKARMEGNR